jgi:hypothetical protein
MVKKTCYFLQTNSKIPYFMCDWENNFNHFVNFQEIPEGFYTDDQKQSAYKGKGRTNDDRCHQLQADSWEYLLKNHLSIYDDSLGTEGLDSESDKADANLAQYGAGSNNKDGGTGTCTKPSAEDALTKNKILHFINVEEYPGALESCKENNGSPPILLAKEAVASV